MIRMQPYALLSSKIKPKNNDQNFRTNRQYFDMQGHIHFYDSKIVKRNIKESIRKNKSN